MDRVDILYGWSATRPEIAVVLTTDDATFRIRKPEHCQYCTRLINQALTNCEGCGAPRTKRE